MTPILRIKPGVRLTGLKPEMSVVLDVVPIVFGRKGYDCWLTCAVEERDSGLHPEGKALDFDSSTNVPLDTGKEIERSAESFLGPEFDVDWHGPRYHLHVEHQPKD